MSSATDAMRGVDARRFVVRWSLFLLVLVAAASLPALYYRLQQGLSVTHLGSVVPWGLWVAFYIYFIGLSAGSFLLSTLIYVFRREDLEPVGRIAVLQGRFQNQTRQLARVIGVGENIAGMCECLVVFQNTTFERSPNDVSTAYRVRSRRPSAIA